MKKKFISFCTILCLILPCFFAVACKEKNDGDKVKAYSYSITLKGAKGKIDESTLSEEYDYSTDKTVSWNESNGDYTISVTRNSVLTGSAIVSLLEGYDYSNLSLTVNSESAKYSIKSGSNTECANAAHLTDRQLVYKYEKMSKTTNLVVDFTNCKLSKVTLDLQKLKSRGVSYYVVQDDFVTLEEAQNNASNNFSLITQDSVTVDYGTIIACDSSEQLVVNVNNSGELNTFSYATYGARYFTTSNRIQYLKAQRSGSCEVYSVTSDASKNGSVRILSSSGLKYASNLEDLQSSRFDTSSQEFEYFDGEMLSFAVYQSNTVYIELKDNAQNFTYHLVNRLDEKWNTSNILHVNTIEGSERKYLKFDLVDQSGSALASKYLVRKPINQADYFMVYATGMKENTSLSNASAIVIGAENKPFATSSITDKVIYYFETSTPVRVSVPAVLTDNKSDKGQNINSITITTDNRNLSNGSAIRENTIADVTVNPNNNTVMEVNCYSQAYTRLYRMNFSYDPDDFDEFEFTVSANDLHLYNGENIYYSLTPQISSSWAKLTSSVSVVLTNNNLQDGNTPAIYYIMESDRDDAQLRIENIGGEYISSSNRFYDCFGRALSGKVEINGKQVDLSKARFLEIDAGYYDYNVQTATIVRNYDETYHEVGGEDMSNSNIMVSLNGSLNVWDFSPLNTMGNLKIRYTGIDASGEIYYYVNSNTNNYIVLKDSDSNIVSTGSLVYNNGVAKMIDGNYVYCLSLNGGYYEEGEEFTIEEIKATYQLSDAQGRTLAVYTGLDKRETTSDLYLNTTYFMTCARDCRIDIYDEKGNVVIGWETIQQGYIPSDTTLFFVKFKFAEFTNYAPGTVFKLIQTVVE